MRSCEVLWVWVARTQYAHLLEFIDKKRFHGTFLGSDRAHCQVGRDRTIEDLSKGARVSIPAIGSFGSEGAQ